MLSSLPDEWCKVSLMTTTAPTIQLGEVTITPVVEIGRSSFPTTSMLPDSTPEAIAAHHAWLKPSFFDDATGDLASRIQTFIVRTPEHTVLIDTCVGNDKDREGNPLWHMRSGGYLEDLRAAGVTPADVDYVICTHLHVDHVGWNTRLDREAGGREHWVPTFPKARYIFAGEEWEYWSRVATPWMHGFASSRLLVTRLATSLSVCRLAPVTPCSPVISCTAPCRWRSHSGRAGSAPTRSARQ
jgi:Metallo-beta-lactamase superfamily